MNGYYYKKAVVLKQLNDFERWRNRESYKFRWRVEGAFSSMKRRFGDHVSIRNFPIYLIHYRFYIHILDSNIYLFLQT